jgi:hypothetical protein
MSTDPVERNEIQNNLFSSYMDYAAFSFETLPEDMRMTKEQRIQFKISYDMFSNRKSGNMNGKNIVHLFAEYSRSHEFTIPLHPEFLLPLVNPYFNNLLHFVIYIFFILTN